jgi:ribosomal protein L30E
MLSKKEIKEAIKTKKIFIGTRSVFRGIKQNKVKSVVYASNCPEDKVKDLNRYATISNIKLEKFDGNSAELGEFCGKPFSILMIGIEK